MAIFFHFSDQHIFLHGQTYPCRARIKGLGGRFMGDRKMWIVLNTAENLSAVEELCRQAGGGPWKSRELTTPDTEPVVVQPGRSVSSGADPDSSDGMTVGELMQRAAGLVDRGFPDAIWVIGEVQNLQLRPSGYFLDLSEEGKAGHAQSTVAVKCTLWKQQLNLIASRLPGKVKPEDILQDGMKIRCCCRVQLYRGRGHLSLNILNIDSDFTRGTLALARERLLKELRQSGLDQDNKKLSPGPAPLKIGLISAAGSRAYSDFIHQLESGGFPGTVLFLPTVMQGEQTPSGVCQALETLASGNCDLIVLTRGGGSAADLRWFDAKEMALAIAKCKVPVLTAIGHHEDFCVAEEISYQKQKTPTAAADYILEQFTELQKFLDSSLARLQLNAERKLSRSGQSYLNLQSALQIETQRSLQRAFNSMSDLLLRLRMAPGKKLGSVEMQLENFEQSLFGKAGERINSLTWKTQNLLPEKLSGQADRLLAKMELTTVKLLSGLKEADPALWLNRGWTRLYRKTRGENLKTVKSAVEGEEVSARFSDGLLELKVVNISIKEGITECQKM